MEEGTHKSWYLSPGLRRKSAESMPVGFGENVSVAGCNLCWMQRLPSVVSLGDWHFGRSILSCLQLDRYESTHWRPSGCSRWSVACNLALNRNCHDSDFAVTHICAKTLFFSNSARRRWAAWCLLRSILLQNKQHYLWCEQSCWSGMKQLSNASIIYFVWQREKATPCICMAWTCVFEIPLQKSNRKWSIVSFLWWDPSTVRWCILQGPLVWENQQIWTVSSSSVVSRLEHGWRTCYYRLDHGYLNNCLWISKIFGSSSCGSKYWSQR